MSARDHLRLGPDGKYIWVENPDESELLDAHDEASDKTAVDDVRQNLTTISSSMSGPGIGDDVAAKRANLLNAKGTLQTGRRESPEPYDPRPTRIMYVKGFIAGLVVLVVVVAIAIFLGADYTVA